MNLGPTVWVWENWAPNIGLKRESYQDYTKTKINSDIQNLWKTDENGSMWFPWHTLKC